MHQNNDLYHHLLNKAKQLTDDWYNSIDKSTATGVYASTDETVIARLKAQNYSFHEHLIQVFVEEDESFFHSFEEWVNEIASDLGHQTTPTHIILREFLNVQDQYVSMITGFAKENEDKYSNREVNLWISIVLKAFGKIMTRFVEVHDMLATKRLKSQQALINELSAPVIQLQAHMGLLPVVGEIDTQRAKYLLE
ncbi:MAG: RsbT co-antagonist protein RsbRB, partial [Paenisporosarcina sp.]